MCSAAAAAHNASNAGGGSSCIAVAVGEEEMAPIWEGMGMTSVGSGLQMALNCMLQRTPERRFFIMDAPDAFTFVANSTFWKAFLFCGENVSFLQMSRNLLNWGLFQQHLTLSSSILKSEFF